MEIFGSDILFYIEKVLEAINSNRVDLSILVTNLRMIDLKTNNIADYISSMPRECKPATFYHNIRPFLDGYEVLIAGEIKKFRGGSAAQSSLIQAIDKFLGVEHKGKEGEYLQEMLAYMPLEHRKILEKLSIAGLKFRKFVLDQPVLKDAYNKCIESLTKLRNIHYNLIKVYVFKFSKESVGTKITQFLNKVKDETSNNKV